MIAFAGGNLREQHFRVNLGQYIPAKSPIFLPSRNPCSSLVGERAKNEPCVRKRSWCILSI